MVQAEGEHEKELYEKYMCYCKSSGSDLSDSIAAAEAKISSLPSEIEAAEEAQVQAKEAMAEATAQREKEASTYAAYKADKDANMLAIAGAVAALEKGMAGSFLQTSAAQVLKKFADGSSDIPEDSRQVILAFLEGNPFSQGYAPQSGQITGILKELSDDMGRDLDAATKVEEEALAVYNELMAAKTKEVAACTAAIEAKTKQIGELGIEIVELKEDLSDTEAAFMEDKKFLADLEKNCAAKTAEWDVVVKTRADELAALADTIKVLNDDDALELFKKTLPSAGAFLQIQVTAQDMRARALTGLKKFMEQRPTNAKLELLALALEGKKIGFEKVIKKFMEQRPTNAKLELLALA